jgi:hypothetical protein
MAKIALKYGIIDTLEACFSDALTRPARLWGAVL